MLTKRLQEVSQTALQSLAEGASLAEVLGVIIHAAESSPEAVCSVLSSHDGLRISSGDIPAEDLVMAEVGTGAGQIVLSGKPFAAAWREPIYGARKNHLGVFCLFQPDTVEFEDDSINFCRLCAHLAGLAIERKRDERRIVEREAELFALVEAMIEGIITIDEKGRIQALNTAAEKMFGYTVEELLGKNVKMLMVGEHHSNHDTYLSNYLETGKKKIIGIGREVEGLRKDGSVFPLDLAVSEHWVGDERKFTGILRDITERKQSELALRRSEQRIATLLSNLPGMAYRSCEGEFEALEFVSSGSQTLTGHAPEDLVGNACLYQQLIHPNDRDRVQQEKEAALHKGEAFEVQYRIKGPGGERHVWEKGRRVEGNAHVEGFIIDVTERVELEAQLRQAQKLEAVGTLAAGIAHDFNNLLMGIKGCTTVALSKLPPESPARRFLEEGNAAAERGSQLTRQLLTFSRQSRGERRPMNVNDVLDRVDVMLRRLLGSQITLTIEVSSSESRISGDAAQLEQVLVNLVVNARDAMPKGGPIDVRTRSEVRDGRPWIVLEVEDRGTGMDEATQRRIFEPFFTTKSPDKGTGLGLSSVYGILQEHGATIEVDSELGRGTIMRVLLPTLTEAGVTGP